MGLEQLIEHQTQPGISGKTSRQTLPMIHLFILVDGEAGMKGELVESTRQLLFQKKGLWRLGCASIFRQQRERLSGWPDRQMNILGNKAGSTSLEGFWCWTFPVIAHSADGGTNLPHDKVLQSQGERVMPAERHCRLSSQYVSGCKMTEDANTTGS